jgi:hypothetical protein
VTKTSKDNDLDDELDGNVTEANEIYLPVAKVRRRYGLSEMGLYRWLSRDFPQPVYFGTRRYWKLSELITYERWCASQQHEHREDRPTPNQRLRQKQNRLRAETEGK